MAYLRTNVVIITVIIINVKKIMSKKLTEMKKSSILVISVCLLTKYILNNCSPTWEIQILALDLLPVTVLRMLLRNPWRTLGKAKYLTSKRWRHYRRRTAIETCTICEILFPFLSANMIDCQFYLFIDNIADCCKQSLLKSVLIHFPSFSSPPPRSTMYKHFSLLV